MTSGPSPHGWHKLVPVLECEKKFQLENVRGLHIPVDQTPSHFALGLLFHAYRARWFTLRFKTDKESWESCIAAGQEAMEEAPAPMNPEDERLALDIFAAYIEHYSKLPLPEPVAAEYLVGPSKLDSSDSDGCVFTARLDDVSQYPEAGMALCVGESKTASDTAGAINEYTLHGQPMLQLALWKIAEQGASQHGMASGVMMDIVRKPQRRAGKYTKPAFMRQFLPVNERALNWYVQMIRAAKKRSLEIKWDSEVPRNIVNCTRMHGRMRVPCQFRELCMHGRSAAGQFVMKNGERALDWYPQPEMETAPWD